MDQIHTYRRKAFDARSTSFNKLVSKVIVLAFLTTSCWHKNAVVAGQPSIEWDSKRNKEDKRSTSCGCCYNAAGGCAHKQKIAELQALIEQQNAKINMQTGEFQLDESTIGCISCNNYSERVQTLEQELQNGAECSSCARRPHDNIALSMEDVDQSDTDQTALIANLQETVHTLQKKCNALQNQPHACPGLKDCVTCLKDINEERRRIHEEANRRLQTHKLLETQHDALNQRCQELEQAAQKFQDQLSQSDITLQDRDRRIEEEKRRCDMLQTTSDQVKNSLLYTSNKLNQAEARRDELESENKNLKDSADALKRRLESLQRTKEYQSQKAEVVEQERETLKKELALLKDALQKSNQSAQKQLEAYLQQANDRETQLQKELMALRAKEKALLEQKKKESGDSQKYKDEIESLNKDKELLLDRRRNSAEQHILAFDAMKLHLDQAKQALRKAELSSQNQAEKIAELQSALQQQKDQNGSLEKELQEQKHSIAMSANTHKQEAIQKDKEIADLKSALQQQKVQNGNLEKKLQEQQHSIAMSASIRQQEAIQKDKEIANLKSALQQQKVQNGNLEKKLQEQQQAVGTEMDKKNQELQKANLSAQNRAEKIDELNKQIVKLKKASPCNCTNHKCACCLALSKQISDLKGQLGGQRSRNQTLKKQNRTISTNSKKYENRGNSLFQKIEEQEGEIKSLKSKLKQPPKKEQQSPKKTSSQKLTAKIKWNQGVGTLQQFLCVRKKSYNNEKKLPAKQLDKKTSEKLREALKGMELRLYTQRHTKSTLTNMTQEQILGNQCYNVTSNVQLKVQNPSKYACTIRDEKTKKTISVGENNNQGKAIIDLGLPNQDVLHALHATSKIELDSQRRQSGLAPFKEKGQATRNLNHECSVNVKIKIDGTTYNIKLKLPTIRCEVVDANQATRVLQEFL